MSGLPFSPSRAAGDLLFLAGQVGIKDGKLISDNIKDQTRQAIENVRNLLTEKGISLNEIIDITVFLIDQDDYGAFNEIYSELLPAPFPTRTTVTVRSLPLGARVELKAIAKVSFD